MIIICNVPFPPPSFPPRSKNQLGNKLQGSKDHSGAQLIKASRNKLIYSNELTLQQLRNFILKLERGSGGRGKGTMHTKVDLHQFHLKSFSHNDRLKEFYPKIMFYSFSAYISRGDKASIGIYGEMRCSSRKYFMVVLHSLF